jgi:hypothetical protein
MKKLGLGILIGVVVLAISGIVAAIPNQAADIAKEKAKVPDLEKIEFIHWKKGFAKPTCNNNGVCEPELGENPSCADCKNAEEESTVTCYAFLGKYGKKYLQWRELPVNYVINPTNPDGLSETFVTSAISAGAEEWDDWTGAELFNDAYGVDDTATYGVQDYVNAITWDDYSTEGVIAVTTVWYNPATKTIVEFDIMFDTDWTWGDATVDPTVMDLQNIATHELGHGVGLADVYETECSAVTMYGYSDYGETQKRTLELPDITGIQKLYGSL